jgi:Xaa-Pro aminopeptidase
VNEEAARKRGLALEAAGGRLVTARPWDVRWLLCGRGRPVDEAAPSSPYTVVLDGEARVLYQNIERARIEAEERFEELGYEPVPHPWFEQPRLQETPAVLDELRRALCPEELERYRSAGADAAAAMRATLLELRPALSEIEAAAMLVSNASLRDFFCPVVLVGGEERQPLYRHPLPTRAPLGRHALLAITAERQGLHVSLTRLVSFGPPPGRLSGLAAACAEVDATFLAASRPGASLGEVFASGQRAYAEQGFDGEWRHHHQGGLTGYRGREVFGTPGEPALIPEAAAVAWNPSIGGGAKSEDTALVTAAGVEVITRTEDLGELETSGLPRPAIVQLR